MLFQGDRGLKDDGSCPRMVRTVGMGSTLEARQSGGATDNGEVGVPAAALQQYRAHKCPQDVNWAIKFKVECYLCCSI